MSLGEGYVWRDPKRVSASQREELDIHDRRMELYENHAANPAREDKQERLAFYTDLRNAGKTGPAAADAVGVSAYTGRAYEREYQAAKEFRMTDLHALEMEWAGRMTEGVPLDCIRFIPYPMGRFRLLLETAMAHGSGPFLDLGAGIGTKVLAAKEAGLDAHGIELVPAYLAEAERIGADVRPGDIRHIQASRLALYGIIYLNHPLAGAEATQALENRVRVALRPGGVLICVNGELPAPAGAHWLSLVQLDGSAYAVKKAGAA
jgi:SAM-dependent methyltransferase